MSAKKCPLVIIFHVVGLYMASAEAEELDCRTLVGLFFQAGIGQASLRGIRGYMMDNVPESSSETRPRRREHTVKSIDTLNTLLRHT